MGVGLPDPKGKKKIRHPMETLSPHAFHSLHFCFLLFVCHQYLTNHNCHFFSDMSAGKKTTMEKASKVYRNCDQNLPQALKFCFSCSVKVDIEKLQGVCCKGCGLDIKENYKFFPSCAEIVCKICKIQNARLLKFARYARYKMQNVNHKNVSSGIPYYPETTVYL